MEKQASLKRIVGAHLTISWTADNVEQINALIYGNRLVIVTDTAKKLDICCGSAYSTIHSNLWYHKTCGRYMPKHIKVSRDMCGNTGMWNMHAISAVISWWGGFCAVDCHRWWNMGAPLWIWQQMLNHGVESHAIAQDKIIPKCAFCQQSDVDTVLGH
jgi:hypothetical protein